MAERYNVRITHDILKLISDIDEFKGSWKYLAVLTPDRLDRLRKVATIESAGSSTRIEGARLSDAEVERLLSGLATHSFQSRDEEEVAGYAEAMELVFGSFDELTLTENYIKQLHALILKYSSKDKWHKGEYKKFPNNVEAFDKNGKSVGIVFETSTPFETPLKMKELITWTAETMKSGNIHPLIITATFVVHFLAIHPFQDGNGRLSRVLTNLLLLQNGYSYAPYASIEAIIEQSKHGYYIALRKSQQTIETDKNNIQPWVMFFLKTLQMQKNNLLKKIEGEKSLLELPPLSLQLLELTKTDGRLTLSRAAKNIDAKERTIRDHIQRLVKKGYLIRHGERKAAWYSLG